MYMNWSVDFTFRFFHSVIIRTFLYKRTDLDAFKIEVSTSLLSLPLKIKNLSRMIILFKNGEWGHPFVRFFNG